MRKRCNPCLPHPDTSGGSVSVPSEPKKARRLRTVFIGFLVCTGTAAIAVLMLVLLPTQYRQQAREICLPALLGVETGDSVMLGTYEQDNDRTNGAEPIEWVVLRKTDDRILLISRFVLDCVCFNSTDGCVVFCDSTLRQWLDQTFYDTAFNGAEKLLICSTVIKADRNPNFDTDPGGAVTARVFIPSIPEIFLYFEKEPTRQCSPTTYALSKDVKTDPTSGNCVWWLRTPGFDTTVAARILSTGQINYCGYPVHSKTNGVRPCVWVRTDLPETK